MIIGGSSRPGDHRPGPTASPSATEEVDLLARVASFTAPFRPGTGYRPPTGRQRHTVARAVGLLLDGEQTRARRLLDGVDLTLTPLSDRTTGRRYLELSDRTEHAPAPRGWGRVYLPVGTPARWSVQVPHPVSDRDSERLGVRVLRGSPGGVLVLAGAHRDAGRGDTADMAHRRDTVFDAVVAELTARRLPGIQLHGFAQDSAPRYDAIASTGAGRTARPEGRELADALRGRGLDVCRAWVRDCPLEGRSNVQGRRAAAHQVPFLHLELAPQQRTRPQRADRVAAAISEVTSRWAHAAAPSPSSSGSGSPTGQT
ncbi:hypothetical protein [Streptomyces sp. NPDC058045]|uniref:hypothetical protein n=1 Tax=Streptomyces sp. NPDC058045 TaxID=3346311 RepID=UPI0036E47C25